MIEIFGVSRDGASEANNNFSFVGPFLKMEMEKDNIHRIEFSKF